MASHRPKTLVWRADEPTRARATPPPPTACRVISESSSPSTHSTFRTAQTPPSRTAGPPASTSALKPVPVIPVEEVLPRLKFQAPPPPHPSAVPASEPAAAAQPDEPHVLEPEDEFLQSASSMGVRHLFNRHRTVQVVKINRGSIVAHTPVGKKWRARKIELLYLYEPSDLRLIRLQRVKCEATRALGLQPGPASKSPPWPLEWLEPVVGQAGPRLVVTFIDGWQLAGVVRQRSRYAFRLELPEGGQVWAYRHAVARIERQLSNE